MNLNRRDEKKLREMCADRGVKLIRRVNGHWQLLGPLLVNYWPDSKKKSAYIAGTSGKVSSVSIKQAIDMCFSAPSSTKIKSTKRKPFSSRRRRKALLKSGKHSKCKWCRTPMTLDNSTLEHIIPLARGGLDNANNVTLACGECNHARGHDMPELANGG